MVDGQPEPQYDRRRIENFGRRVSPLVRGYLVENGQGSIMGIATAGRLFAVELYRRLLTPAGPEPFVDVTYFEVEKDRLGEYFEQDKARIIGRHLIVVDDDIHTKQTYEMVQSALNSLKEQYNIPSVNWAVEFDGPGVATWACNRINNGTRARV